MSDTIYLPSLRHASNKSSAALAKVHMLASRPAGPVSRWMLWDRRFYEQNNSSSIGCLRARWDNLPTLSSINSSVFTPVPFDPVLSLRCDVAR